MSALVIIFGLILGCGPNNTTAGPTPQTQTVPKIRYEVTPAPARASSPSTPPAKPSTPPAKPPARPGCSQASRPATSAARRADRAATAPRGAKAPAKAGRRGLAAATRVVRPNRGVELTKKRRSVLPGASKQAKGHGWVPEPVRPSFTGVGVGVGY